MPLIPLTQGQCVQVDPEDFQWAKDYKWYAQKSSHKCKIVYYAVRWQGRQKLRLHRLILNAKSGEKVDHWNGDTLDCRRKNLRLATSQQNAFNAQKTTRRTTSRFKGVCYTPKDSQSNPWRAYIGGGVSAGATTPWTHLGCFSSEIAAALAYDRAARNLFGRFARLNFPI